MDNIKPELFSKTSHDSECGFALWNEAAKRAFHALGVEAVLFNGRLEILDSTPNLSDFLVPDNRLDTVLSKGTDSESWNRWTEILSNVLASGQKAVFPAVRFRSGGRELDLNLTCIPVSESNNKTIQTGVLLIEDVTRIENQQKKQVHAERLGAVGKLAGRVAHELNNPLDGILRYINLSLRVIEEQQTQKAVEYLRYCRSGLGRMVQILGELLEFSRSTHLNFEQAPLDELVEDALHTMAPSLSEIRVRMHRHYGGPALPVRSDSLFQVFCNLIKNAADAMEGKGELTITLRSTGREWACAFQDTGHGFSPDRAEDLFKPFYTTKPYGHGTGLGLAICRDILEKLGGRITAENAPERGSIFTVFLPSVPPQTERTHPA